MNHDSTRRLDTRLESEAAEFLVLGNLLLERIPAYKTYTNMPGYDLVATDPERNTSAKVQVKSRWRTNAPGFPIKNFGCDFVVFCRLNRGSKNGTGEVRAPQFYVFPVEVVKGAWNPEDPWGKVMVSRIEGWMGFLNRWDLIRDFLAPGPEPVSLGEVGRTPINETNPSGGAVDVAGRGIAMSEFRHQVAALDGQRLETARRQRGFHVRVMEQGLEITPESSGQPRPVSWARIAHVLSRYGESHSLNPADYQDITYHGSYLLAILQRMNS